jgi:uncharacterized metal-binding protein YceD (DUF177 family)
MKVHFHEIKDQELTFHFDESTPWVMEVVGALDERLDKIQRPPGWKPRSRPTQVHFSLRRVDDLVHVSGKVKTQLYLLCSLCADAFQYPVQLSFHTLLTQTEMYAEAPRESSRKGAFDHDSFESDIEESELGLDDEDEEVSLGAPMDFSASDFEVTVVKEAFADLKEILNEQIVLTLPMQPKPDVTPQGDCVKCGKPQGAMRITSQTAEPLKENPFAILKDFNKKKSDS